MNEVTDITAPSSVGVSSTKIEPDDLMLWLPDGVVSAMSSAWSNGQEMIPMVDVKVSVGGKVVNFILNESACDELSALFERMAFDARSQAESGNKSIYGGDAHEPA